MFLDIICILGLIVLSVFVIRAFINQRKVDKQIKKMFESIEALHYNQNVLVSTISQVYRSLRTNERQTKKNSKVLNRQIHVRGAGPEAERSDAV